MLLNCFRNVWNFCSCCGSAHAQTSAATYRVLAVCRLVQQLPGRSDQSWETTARLLLSPACRRPTGSSTWVSSSIPAGGQLETDKVQGKVTEEEEEEAEEDEEEEKELLLLLLLPFMAARILSNKADPDKGIEAA